MDQTTETTATPDTPQAAPAPAPEAKTNGAGWEPPAPPPFNPVLKLRKEVRAPEGMVKELRFREPTAGDIERFGMPLLPNMQFNTPIMMQLLADLAGVPPSTIKQLHPRDWTNAAYRIGDFFIPDGL